MLTYVAHVKQIMASAVLWQHLFSHFKFFLTFPRLFALAPAVVAYCRFCWPAGIFQTFHFYAPVGIWKFSTVCKCNMQLVCQAV